MSQAASTSADIPQGATVAASTGGQPVPPAADAARLPFDDQPAAAAVEAEASADAQVDAEAQAEPEAEPAQ